MWTEGLYFGGFESIIINEDDSNGNAMCWSCVNMIYSVDDNSADDDGRFQRKRGLYNTYLKPEIYIISK